jgi:hypothetical protein
VLCFTLRVDILHTDTTESVVLQTSCGYITHRHYGNCFTSALGSDILHTDTTESVVLHLCVDILHTDTTESVVPQPLYGSIIHRHYWKCCASPFVWIYYTQTLRKVLCFTLWVGHITHRHCGKCCASAFGSYILHTDTTESVVLQPLCGTNYTMSLRKVLCFSLYVGHITHIPHRKCYASAFMWDILHTDTTESFVLQPLCRTYYSMNQDMAI